MLLTEAMKRIPGTWYDLTEGTTELRIDEASLGLRPHASHEFRRLSKQTIHNLYHPAAVDVDIHFITIGETEIVKVRGRKGVRSFRFRLAEAKHASGALPKGADPLGPLNERIRAILDAVVQVR
jgi:acetylornithine deacetylase/succinyl-diaminopimelate desuccinylase-like protein